MKKIIVFAFLLIGLATTAQDYNFISKSKVLESQESAVQFASATAATANKELHLYKVNEFNNLNKLKVIFAAKDETDATAYLSFLFAIDFEGESKALEIKGVKHYRLIELESKYLTVFPIWQNYFKATASLEKTVNDYKSQRLNEPEKNIRYLLQNQNERWLIIQQ